MSQTLPAPVEDQTPDLFSDTRLQLIRDNTAQGAPEHVFRAMLEIARVRNLDPLAKQISVIKFKDAWQVMTTIDGYRAIAESTGTYAGSDEPVFGPALEALRNGKRPPEWASVTVWKFAHGQRVPFTAKVYWDEYYGGNFTWDKMPRTMLAKVAESHALRKGFPKVLSGLYTTEEMEQAGPVIDHATGEIVEAPQGSRTAPGRDEATPRQLEMVRERWGALRQDPGKLNAQCRKWYGQQIETLSRDNAEDMIRRLDQKITAASPQGVTPQPPDDEPEQAGMSDAEIHATRLAIDADIQEASIASMGGNDRWTN